MASIRERSAGVWQVRSYKGRVDGRDQYLTRTVRGTRAQAKTVGKQLDAEVASGVHKSDGSTVAGYLDRWLEFHGPRLSPSTLAGYEKNIRVHIKPALGTKAVAEVRPRDLDALYSTMQTAKLSPATIRQVHAVISKAFGQAVKWGTLIANPAAGASPPPVRQKDITPPLPEDVRAAMAKLEARPTLLLFVRLAAVTGCRRGELVGLRWGDFNEDEATLTVSRGILLVDGAFFVKGTKTDRVKRMGLDARTVVMLVQHHDRILAEAKRNKAQLVRDPYLFASDLRHGAPWKPDDATGAWRRLAVEAGLGPVRLHDLRHFMVSQSLAAGVDVRTVAGRAGHAQTSMTLNRYGHFMPAKDAAAADGLGALVDG